MLNTQKETLLLMGCSFGTQDALNYAKSQGIYTIVTDHLPPEQQPLKLQADAYWMCDVKDLDTLEQNCRRAGVTGIFGGTSEFCLDYTKALCKRLGLSFYASEEGWAASRDKELFKQHCSACGLDVPRQYEISADGPLPADLRWPVIVKPVDACAQLGITVCHHPAELREGYSRAMAHSVSGRVIVEDYIQGDELCSMYLLQDGKPILLELLDCVHTPVEQTDRFAYISFQSRFTAEYQQQIADRVKTLFARLGCKEGPAYLQMIRRNGVYYFLELGYRLNSVPSWPVEYALHGIDVVKHTVDLALGCHHTVRPVAPSHRLGAVYFVWAKPGIIQKIEGPEAFQGNDSVRFLYQTYDVGNQIPQEMSMGRILFRIALFAVSPQEMRAHLMAIRCKLHVYDTAGLDMLYHLADLDTVCPDKGEGGLL